MIVFWFLGLHFEKKIAFLGKNLNILSFKRLHLCFSTKSEKNKCFIFEM